MKESWWWPFAEAAWYFFLAAFGGAIGYVLRQDALKQPVNVRRVGIEALAAGFVGYLVYQLCLYMALPSTLTGPVVGVCGWLGSAATIRLLEPLIERILGAKHHADK